MDATVLIGRQLMLDESVTVVGAVVGLLIAMTTTTPTTKLLWLSIKEATALAVAQQDIGLSQQHPSPIGPC